MNRKHSIKHGVVSAEEASKLIHELAVEARKLFEKARRERERTDRVKSHTISLSSFEGGVLLSFLWSHKDDDRVKALKGVIDQLIELHKKTQREAGVTVERLPSGLIKLTDRFGNTVIRAPYEWEDVHESG